MKKKALYFIFILALIFMAGCGEKHVHDFSSDWKSNENEHFHACECGEKIDVASHEWDDGVITVKPTQTEKGTRKFTCSVCKRTKEESIPALSEAKWSYSASKHWYYKDGDNLTKYQEEEHSFDGDECSICGYHKTMITSAFEWSMAIAMGSTNYTIEEECTDKDLEFVGLYKRVGSLFYLYEVDSVGMKSEFYLEKANDDLLMYSATSQPGRYQSDKYEYGEDEFISQCGIPFDNATENLVNAYNSFHYDEETRTYKGSYTTNITGTTYTYNNIEFAFYEGKLVSMDYTYKETQGSYVQIGNTKVHLTSGTTKITKPWDNNLDFYYVEVDGGILYTGPKRAMEEVVVPTEVEIDGETLKVVGIGQNAFVGYSIDSLVIPDSITNVDPSAFDNFNGTNIKKITASTSILALAANVNGLEEVVVSSCDDKVFSAKFSPSIKKVTLLDGITELAEDCFNGCKNLTDIVLPSTLEKIGKAAFKNCDALTSIIIPDKVTTIEDETFASCDVLASVTLPKSLESIGSNAFYDDDALQIKSFPSTLKSIGDLAFEGCFYSDTNDLVLPEGLTTIGQQTFLNSGLRTITIPNSVTSIGSGCFRNSRSLQKVVLGQKVATLSSEMFRNCVSLTTIDISKCENLTSIGSGAFAGCSKLQSFSVPNTVTTIGQSAFSDCSSLKELVLPFIGNQSGVKENDDTRYPFGYIFGTSQSTGSTQTAQKYYDASGAHDVSYYIPDSLETVTITKDDILEGAFLNVFKSSNKPLTIVINDEITFVDALAFKDCNYSSTKDASGAIFIGNILVGFDSNVTNITIKGDIHMIAKNASVSCNIESLILEDDFNGIVCDGAFTSMSKLNTLETPLEYLPLFPKDKIENLVITSGETLGDKSLAGYTALTNLTLPETITSCHSKAFEGTENIDRLIAPANVLSSLSQVARLNISYLQVLYGYIPENAFKDSTKLTELILNEGVKEIEDHAFENCLGITSVILPASLTKIDSNAFKGSGLIELELPDTLTTIGQNAFNGCPSLKKVNVLGTVSLFHVFTECAKLEEITFKVLNMPLIELFGQTEFEGSVMVKVNEGNINESTYYFPTSLKKVTILEGEICQNGLKDSPIESVVIGADVTKISSALNNATVNTYYDGTIEDWCNFTFQNLNYNPMSHSKHFYLNDGKGKYDEIVDIVIPSTVTSIGEYQFYNFDQLESITIPATVLNIDANAFRDCDNLTLYCEATSKPNGFVTNWNCDRPYYFGLTKDDIVTVDNYLVTVIDEQITIFKYLGNETALEIPAQLNVNGNNYPITKIEPNAFENCTFITSLIIPDSITTIGTGAFAGCDQVSNLTLGLDIRMSSLFGVTPKNLTSVVLTCQESITSNAFADCIGLESVTLPNTLKTINSSAFKGCSSLQSITLPSSLTTINNNAFQDCSGLNNVYYEGSIEDWCNITFTNANATPMYYASLFHSKDQNNGWEVVTSLDGVFDNITEIGEFQFYGFSQLTSIIIPNNIVSIGLAAFNKCDNLVELSIPFVGGSDEDDEIFGYIFGITNDAKHDNLLPAGLTGVTLTGGTKITSYAFGHWSKLTTFIVPNTVTTIEINAFRDCVNLVSVYIPSSVVKMEMTVFQNSPNVTAYVEVDSKPAGWDSLWYYWKYATGNSKMINVVWGATSIPTNESEQINIDGIVIAPIKKYNALELLNM